MPPLDLALGSRAEATAALQEIKSGVQSGGLPEGTILHRNGLDVHVPFGNGYATYRAANGRATVRTAITREQATTYAPD